MAMETKEELKTPKEAADFLKVKEQTLAVWRCRGINNLPFVKAGRSIRYRGSDLEAFLERNTHTCVTH